MFDKAYKKWKLKELEDNLLVKRYYLSADISEYGVDRHEWGKAIKKLKEAIEWKKRELEKKKKRRREKQINKK